MTSVTVPRRRTTGSDIHRVVAASLRRLSREQPAVKVASIATETGKDPRTVRRHLELMEASGAVVFLDKAHNVVGTPEQLAKALRDATLEPWERSSTDELRVIWDNESDDVFNSL